MFRNAVVLCVGVFLLSACRLSQRDGQAVTVEKPLSTPIWTVSPTPPRPSATSRATDLVPAESPVPENSATPEKKFQLCSPLAEHEISALAGIISDPYAPPPMGKDDRHQGVDFAYYQQGGRESIEGEGVTAILPGRAIAVLNDRLPYGNMVIIETRREHLWPELIEGLEIDPGESLYHLYAHLGQPPLVTLGKTVKCGQQIGEAGKTGYNIPIPHLHLEIRIGPAGTVFESMAFYDTRATEGEMENYKLWRMSGTFRHQDPMRIFVEYWLSIREE